MSDDAGTPGLIDDDGYALTDADGVPSTEGCRGPCCGGALPPPPPPPPLGRFVLLRPCGSGGEPCGGPMYFDRLGIPAGTPLPGPVVLVRCGSVSVCACFVGGDEGSSDTRPAGGVEVQVGQGFASCCACAGTAAATRGEDSPCCPRTKEVLDETGQLAGTVECCCAAPVLVQMTGTYTTTQTNPGGFGTGIIEETITAEIQNARLESASPCHAAILFDVVERRVQKTADGQTLNFENRLDGRRAFWHCGDGVRVRPQQHTDPATNLTLTRAARDFSPEVWPYPVGDSEDMVMRGRGYTGFFSESGGCDTYGMQQSVRFDGGNGVVITQRVSLSVRLVAPAQNACQGCFSETAAGGGAGVDPRVLALTNEANHRCSGCGG